MKTKPIIFLVITVIILIGLFFLLEPKSLSQTGLHNVSQQKTFEIIVKNRKIVSGTHTFQATEGDTITMRLTVDEGGEVHLHGYDKHVDLEKNVPGDLTFTANLTGRFSFELEDSKTDLGVLEVIPK